MGFRTGGIVVSLPLSQTLKMIRSRKEHENGSVVLDSAEGPFELPEVESLFDMEHARIVVREGLAKLTQRQREVLRLYYYEERSMQEIATIMGYNNGTKEYFSFWVDNMGTGYMIENGTMNAEKTCHMLANVN